MAEVICPENKMLEVSLGQFLMEVMRKKQTGLRLDQACAAFADGKYELSYSFSDDDAYQFENLRVVVGLKEEVPSISHIYPAASFYENEMRELFGVHIEIIGIDYKDHLYRMEEVMPMLPTAVKKLLEEMETEAKSEDTGVEVDGGEQ